MPRCAVRALVSVAVAAGLAGCSTGPAEVAGPAGPVTVPVTGTGAPPAAGPSRPAPVATPSGTPTPPAGYAPYALSRAGLTLTLPVPVDWSLTRTARGVDLGDPTGTVLLRVEIVPAGGRDARAGWLAAEPGFRASLPGYRRLGLVDVPGVGDDAADLTFTFEREGVTRQVVDRGIVAGDAAAAVYYSAPQDSYERMRVVFDRATAGLDLS